MHQGKYIFSQITDFLPKLKFDRIVKANQDNTMRWQLSYWNHLLVLIFGQLQGCASLRELTDITVAHGNKSYHLGFGASPINRSALSKANNYRNYHIFREYTEHMITIAQGKRIGREFEINGRFYAFDSSTIDLCMSVFEWAKFRSTKSGIKLHTQIDIVTQIPTFMRITNADVSDVKAMDYLEYEPLAENRWQVELFFKLIKQHLRVKTFWGVSETAVRTQVYAAIITYCLVAIIEHDLKLNRNIYEVMRILSSALLSKDRMADLLVPSSMGTTEEDWKQLEFDFGDM